RRVHGPYAVDDEEPPPVAAAKPHAGDGERRDRAVAGHQRQLAGVAQTLVVLVGRAERRPEPQEVPELPRAQRALLRRVIAEVRERLLHVEAVALRLAQRRGLVDQRLVSAPRRVELAVGGGVVADPEVVARV